MELASDVCCGSVDGRADACSPLQRRDGRDDYSSRGNLSGGMSDWKGQNLLRENK